QAVPLVDLQSAAGVSQLSGTWRGQAMVDLASTQASTDAGYPLFEVLAIEPDSFDEVATFRDDFTDEDMDQLLNQLAVPEGEHPSLLLLPGQPARFGLWLWGLPEDKAALDSYQRSIDGDSDAERVGVLAKLQTAQGEILTVRLQRQETAEQAALQTDRFTLRTNIAGRDVGLRVRIKPDTEGWYYFESSVPALPSSSYPLSLHSLWFQNQATRLGEPIIKSISLVIDDLTVADAGAEQPQVVEDFEDLTRVLFLNVMDGSSIWHGLFTRPTDMVSRSGELGQGVLMVYTRPRQTYALRLRQVWTAAPLPAIASPTFREATQLEVGDVVRAWIGGSHQAGSQTGVEVDEVDFRIVGAVRYFPTMYEQLEAGYLITSRDLLLALLNDTSEQPTNPNEVLVATDGSTSINSLSPMVPMLLESWEAESVRQSLKANPLALGLRSVTFFGSALTTLLSLVGFSTHFYLTVRQREMLYGVMRAMGMSARQLYGSIVVEQTVLILAGLALGTGLGVLLNRITLPRLPVSLADQPPIPPFVPQEDWLAVGSLYLFLAVAFLVILGIVTALLRRARIHQVLRIGQE
ncbi:MAG: ABC transporter permease, partial [Anaerolineae bacterium]